MTADVILARNRANAQKSTGPRTEAGKAASAGNARRHGMTARPDPEAVMTWLTVILADSDAAERAVTRGDPRDVAALRLAVAEARLRATRRSLAEFEGGTLAPDDEEQELAHRAEALTEGLAGGWIRPFLRNEARRCLREIARKEDDLQRIDGPRHRLLRRYHSEAQSVRRRAFAEWIDAMSVSEEGGDVGR